MYVHGCKGNHVQQQKVAASSHFAGPPSRQVSREANDERGSCVGAVAGLLDNSELTSRFDRRNHCDTSEIFHKGNRQGRCTGTQIHILW